MAKTILETIRSTRFFREFTDDLLSDTGTGQSEPDGAGLLRAGRTPFTAAVASSTKRPIVYLTDKPSVANLVYDELGFWNSGRGVDLFPAPDPLFYEPGTWDLSIRADRIRVLTMLAKMAMPGGGSDPMGLPVIVVPLRAFMTRTIDKRSFVRSMRILRVNQVVQPATLVRLWTEIGYLGGEIVFEPGRFSLRGGLLDVWPYTEAAPIRIDFFGDEIDNMYTFDPATQRNIGKIDRVLIPPAREVFQPADKDGTFNERILNEFHIPLFTETEACLVDYLPDDTIVLMDDESRLMDQGNDIEEQAERLRAQSIADGILPDDFPLPYVSVSEIRDRLDSFTLRNLGRDMIIEAFDDFGDGIDLAGTGRTLFTPADRYSGRLTEMITDLYEKIHDGEAVTIVSRQSARIKKLVELSTFYEKDGVNPAILGGTLHEGFVLDRGDEPALHLFTDQEIFGWERPAPRRKTYQATEVSESGIEDFKQGDWVVHIDYGIGQYDGVVTRTIDGISKEFLKLLYAAGDELYVPVHQADRVTNYIGPDSRDPQPTRLGTAEWLNVKSHVREKVVELAMDLLDLYAKRQVVEGYAFPEDSPWQQDLEGAFPYFETEDQKHAIAAVKADMERQRPMDRLVCGDVGFGKTEVALRAAFKAATAGKQVAILVPTTVLAQQHYETFAQRFAPFPVSVEMLSRFRNPKQQKQIIADLKDGKIDVIIGTHRLISADVKFKQLGLVVIDEEQRFGVAQKEFLKKVRTEVDVLTMSATPIPRTLYMALTGVRDISSINTPPDDRVPVVTHVGPYSEKLVRQAILRELERDGQVFYVHNRVQSIYAVQKQLQKLVPEARIGVGHGQMSEKELSSVMDAFYRHDIDVLLSTSIIESGLDVPNANTLIADHADHLGLAQLYQIRGRVGRSTQRAYAYFFRTTKSTPEGLERLEVIAENAQLGSGYSIAMRDLEMRGAGEILGNKQSGSIASVGFNLYTKMLAQAVRTVKDVKGIEISDEDIGITREMGLLFDPITVELPLDIGIPESYVSDRTVRIKLYRRIAAIHTRDKLDAIQSEFEDRFGPIPDSLANLFYQIEVKILAEEMNLTAVIKEGNSIVLRYPALPKGVESRGLEDMGSGIRAGKNAYWLTGLDFANDDWRESVLARMERILRAKE